MARGDRGGYINYPEIQNLLQSLRKKDAALQDEVDEVKTDSPTPPGGPPGLNSGCIPIEFIDEIQADTNLSHVETVIVLNEYIYLAGFETTNPKLKIYRITAGGEFIELSSITLTQEIKRFVLHGPYIYGCNNGSNGHFIISINITDPWNPTEDDQLNIGFAARDLHALGQYLFVVGGASSIASVDISNPSAMVKVN